MNTISRPLKPCDLDPKEICKLAKFLPLYGTVKVDGMGALTLEQGAVTTSFKPIKNRWTRNWMEKHLPKGLHGELSLQKPHATFQDISTAFRSEWGMPKFVFQIFDYVNDYGVEAGYTTRMKNLEFWKHKFCKDKHSATMVKCLLPTVLRTIADVKKFYKQALNNGYEGIVLRTGDGIYKCGTCTMAEGIAWKIKPQADSEGEIIGFEPLQINDSPQVKDAFGRSKRQHLQACKRTIEALGKFIVRWRGFEFGLGGGDMTYNQRVEFWKIRKSLLGEQAKFRYQKVGTKEKPRSPQFAGIRDREDI